MRVARTTVRDEYVEAGESVVFLHDGRVLALTSVPTALLALLEVGPADVTDLAAALTEQFGSPPGDIHACQVVERLVGELSEAGLIVQQEPLDG